MNDIDWSRLPCRTQKVFYASRQAALADRKQFRAGFSRRSVAPHRLRPYQCRHCGGWHLTSH